MPQLPLKLLPNKTLKTVNYNVITHLCVASYEDLPIIRQDKDKIGFDASSQIHHQTKQNSDYDNFINVKESERKQILQEINNISIML